MKAVYIIFTLVSKSTPDPDNEGEFIITVTLVEKARKDTEQEALYFCMDILEKTKDYKEEYTILKTLVKIPPVEEEPIK